MTDRILEKTVIVPDEQGRGHRLVACWLTGGSGRQAEMLPDVFSSEAEAEARSRRDYGVAPEPADPAIDRAP